MVIKTPNFGALSLASIRGAAGAQGIAALLPVQFSIISSMLDEGTELVPGQETAVAINLKEIPENAKFTHFVAKITFSKLDAGAEFTVEGETAEPEAKTVSNKLKVANTKTPELRNVKVRLQDGEVFWSQPGPLGIGKDPYEFPNFATQANTFLEGHPQKGNAVKLTFLVQSDTPARVKIIQPAYETVLLQTKTWTNELDGTLRFDRNLDLDFCGSEVLDLDQTNSTDYSRLHSVRLDLSGTPGNARMLGSVEAHDGREFALVNSQFSIAQEVPLKFQVHCTGLSVCLQADAEAEAYLEVREDLPSISAAAPPLAKAKVQLASSQGPGNSWVFVALEPEINLEARSYWVVIRAIRGALRLGTVSSAALPAIAPIPGDSQKPPPPPRLLVNRGGQLWKPFHRGQDSAAALIRLIYLPDVDHQTAAVELQLAWTSNREEGQKAQPADFSTVPQPAQFDLAGDDVRPGPGLRLRIKSHIRGQITIANLIQEFAK